MMMIFALVVCVGQQRMKPVDDDDHDGYGHDDDDDDDDNDSENYEKHQPCLIGIERVRLSKTLFPIGSPKSKPGLIGDHHHQYIPDCSCLLACSDSC